MKRGTSGMAFANLHPLQSRFFLLYGKGATEQIWSTLADLLSKQASS
jgi:hypothetical protein